MQANTYRILKLVISALVLATMCFTLGMQVEQGRRHVMTGHVSSEGPGAFANDRRDGSDPSIQYGDAEQLALGEDGKFHLVAVRSSQGKP